jgi:hypothetical protein
MVENFAWLPPQAFGVPHQSSPSLDHHFSVVIKSGASVLPSTYIKYLIGVLSNTTSFLLSHITQQKADAPARSCHFILPST